MSVVNLRDLVESYAHKFFKENEREYQKIIGKNSLWRDLVKQVEWKNLRVKHTEAKYQDAESPGQSKSHVLFRSVNCTQNTQPFGSGCGFLFPNPHPHPNTQNIPHPYPKPIPKYSKKLIYFSSFFIHFDIFY